MREITSNFRWYEDLLVWLLIFLVCVCMVPLGFIIGERNVIDHCKNYGAYKINDGEAMLCVVKPLLKNNSGEMNYLRPEGKKPIQVKEI